MFDSIGTLDTGGSVRPVEIVRAFMLAYTHDRLGRSAPVESRVLAHDALDALEDAWRAVVG